MTGLIILIYTFLFILGAGGIYLFQGRDVLLTSCDLSLVSCVLGTLAGLLVTLVTIISSRLFGFIRDLEKEFKGILGRLSISGIILIALSSSIAEETFFRGALQPHLGLIATSLIFGLLHFPINRRYIPWTVFAVGMGFLLGWLFIYTESLITPIITHSLVNGINLYRIRREL